MAQASAESLPRELLIHFYEDMLRIRSFEETILTDIHPRRLMRGSAHLYIGEEAVAVGAMHAIEPEDYVVCTYRGHGHALAKGADPERMFAEIMGRRTGYCKGKGGTMHLADPEIGFLGENAVVGSNIPIGAGAALACKMLKNGRVVLNFFGEGATNTGVFHEAMNLAGLWNLPCVFNCENNRYAISVSLERASAILDLHLRAQSYGMPGLRVNGHDAVEVYQATRQAVALAREQSRPSFLVCDTYRYVGHHLADLGRYRAEAEVVQMRREHDPIHRLEHLLADTCDFDVQALADYRERIRREIWAAAERAKQDPEPEPEEALQDIYTEVAP